MADTVITVSRVAIQDVSAERAAVPVSYTAAYAGDDTDYHAAIFPSGGKGRFSYCINNESNQSVVSTLYGMFSETGETTDDDVFAIDSTGITATASGGKIYGTCTHAFPFYMVRTKAAVAGDAGVVTIYVCFMAY